MNFVWKDGILIRKTLWVEFGDKLVEKDGLICFYCGRDCIKSTAHKANTATIDHIIPKANGGRTQLDNLVICCRACNLEKGSKTDFLTMFRRKAQVRMQNRLKRKKLKP